MRVRDIDGEVGGGGGGEGGGLTKGRDRPRAVFRLTVMSTTEHFFETPNEFNCFHALIPLIDRLPKD